MTGPMEAEDVLGGPCGKTSCPLMVAPRAAGSIRIIACGAFEIIAPVGEINQSGFPEGEPAAGNPGLVNGFDIMGLFSETS